MKPTTSKSDGKKRKKEAVASEPESPKRSKVHAQRKFAQGAGVASPGISPMKERDRSRSAPRIVTPPAEPLLQSRVPRTGTRLLPANLNYLREASVTSSTPSNTSTKPTPQQTPRQSAKKAEKGDDKKKQPAGVQALRKKYQEQRIAKQKATNVTTLAKKVKGKNMVRSTRSTAVVEKTKTVKRVIDANRGKVAAGNVQTSLKRPPGRPPGIVKAKITKLMKKKLMRVGLRSGGSVKEPKLEPKPQTPAKLKKQDDSSATKVEPVQRSSANASTSQTAKVQRPKKSRAEREIGSDFSSDDNEPLLTHKPTQRHQTRGRECKLKSKVAKVESRPVRRTKTAAAAYMEVLTRKLVSPTGDDDQSFEDFPEPPQTRRLEKREIVARETASSSKKVSVEGKLPAKILPKKIVSKVSDEGKSEKKAGKVRPSTRSQVAKAAVPVKKQVVRSLIQKKKLNSLRTLTRLNNSKRLARAATALKTAEAKKSAAAVTEKPKNEGSTKEVVKEKEDESSTRKLRGKAVEVASLPGKITTPLEIKKQEKRKDKTAEKPVKKVNQIEVGLGALAKRPVRKCSTIDKIWIDIDGFTSDEDDFIDIDSMADSKGGKSVNQGMSEKQLVKAKEKSSDEAVCGHNSGDKKLPPATTSDSKVTASKELEEKVTSSTSASNRGPSDDVAIKEKDKKTLGATKKCEKDLPSGKTTGGKIAGSRKKCETGTESSTPSKADPAKSVNTPVLGCPLGKLPNDKVNKSKDSNDKFNKVTSSSCPSGKLAKDKVNKSKDSNDKFGKVTSSSKSVPKASEMPDQKTTLKNALPVSHVPVTKSADSEVVAKSKRSTEKVSFTSAPTQSVSAIDDKLQKSASNEPSKSSKKAHSTFGSPATLVSRQVTESSFLPTTKVLLVPTVSVATASSTVTNVESMDKSAKTLCLVIPAAPASPVVTSPLRTIPAIPPLASPINSTLGIVTVGNKPPTADSRTRPLFVADDTKTENSHSLIAKLAATVSMTLQPVVAKAITKDLKSVTTSEHSDKIKVESVYMKSEPLFKSEDSKIGLKFEDKKNSFSLPDTKGGFLKQVPKSEAQELKVDSKKFPVNKSEASQVTEVQRTKTASFLKSHVKPTGETSPPTFAKCEKSDGTQSKQIGPETFNTIHGTKSNTVDSGANRQDKKRKNEVLQRGNLPTFNLETNPRLQMEAKPSEISKPIQRTVLKTFDSKTSENEESKNSSKKATEQPAKDNKSIDEGTENSKLDEKGKQSSAKDKKSSSAVTNATRRRRAQRSEQTPPSESTRKERPKRQCSNVGKSWIDRDSDDSSFYQSGDEDFLELIRQSELAERRQKEKAERRSRKTSSREEKEGDKFSDSDDEPLKKKSVSSASVASTSTRETTRLSHLFEEPVKNSKNSPGKSEAPQERDNRAGASGLAEVPPSNTVTFVPPPMREPINTHGLDLLSEVVTYGSFGRDTSSEKSTARIEQWLNENLRADSGKAFLGFDDNEIQQPAVPVKNVSYPVKDPVLQFVRVSSDQTRPKQLDSPEKLVPKVTPKNNEPTSSFKRKPVASVQELLKLQKERRGSPKPVPELHSKNCQCNSCVVKKGWFKNKPLPDESKPASREASPAKPFQYLTNAFPGPSNGKIASETSTVKASASVAPIVLNKDIKTVGTQRKMSFLERMRERERKPSACAFSPNNESSVYAFEPEPPEKVSGTNVAPFRNRSVSSRSTHTSNDEAEEDRSRHQSTSIAVQTNFDDMQTEQPQVVPAVPEDVRSNEISTQTEGGDGRPLFFIPNQPEIQGVNAHSAGQIFSSTDLKKRQPPSEKTPMPSPQAVVKPVQTFENQKKKNPPPVGTVQPTARRVPPSATVTRPPTPKKAIKQAFVDSEEIPLSTLKTNMECRRSPSATPSPSRSSPFSSKTNTSPQKLSPASTLLLEGPGKSSARSPTPIASSSADASTKTGSPGVVEAPTFYLTEKEFQDPLEFFERIRPAAERFGLCRIVPPSSFKPDCKVADDMRFTAYNQFVHRMLHRWGPSTRETMAMKKYLKTQSISLKPPPCVGGMEVDLPRLYKAVQTCGGLMKVIEKQKWQNVADMLRIPKAAHDRATKMDSIYCQYLLPYDTLKPEEREQLLSEVDVDWATYESKIGEEAAEEEEEEEENYIEECEECIVKGRNMALSQFYRIARNTMSMWFKSPEPSPSEVEEEFWKHVTERNNHVCVHSGSIDSSGWGYGFPVGKNNFAKHPWNLKVLTNNHGSVLRSLGPVMGVTVPTLHVGMVFAAFCWYRDPHGLPWIEYLHTGAPKIWYGISDDNSDHLRDALTKLLPHHIRNQRIWLPCDTAMAPPERLAELGVPLSRTTQEPGQFVLVFPRAFTSSLCTGYLVSESVYFALPSWLQTAEQVFQDIHESAESSAFSLDNLLFSIAGDSRASLEVLKQVLPMVQKVRDREIEHRKSLGDLGVKSEMLPRETNRKRGRNAEPEAEHECDVCRCSLFLSMVSVASEESVFCLKHGLQHLREHPDQLSGSKHLYHFDQDEVNQVYSKLEERISAKLQKSSKK